MDSLPSVRAFRLSTLFAGACGLALFSGGILSEGEARAQSDVPFEQQTIDAEPPDRPYYKLVGDVNGDTLPDILIGGRNGPLTLYAAPDWKKTDIAEGGWSGVNGEIADIDGDGDPDVVMCGVVWFSNPLVGGGEWTLHRIDDQGGHDIEVSDLDRDGRLDVVSRDQSAFGGGDRGGNQIFVYYQTAPNEWTKLQLESPHGEGLKLGDLDRDGDADIVIGARWYENTGGRAADDWTEHVFTEDWTEPDTKVEVGDVNADGRLDVVLTPAELKGETYQVAWYEAPADPAEGGWAEHVIVESIECVIHALALGDFNNDGSLDVAFAEMHQGEDPDEVCVFLNSERGTRWHKQVLSKRGSHDIVVADIGNDGDLDIIGANHAEYHPLELWENQTNPQNTAWRSWKRHVIDDNRPEKAVYIYAGDLDGDDMPDIVAGAWRYQNPGRPEGDWRRSEIGAPLHNVAALHDFDRDGDLDIFGTQGIGSSRNNNFAWAENDGRARFTIHTNIDTGGTGDFLQGVGVFEDSSGALGIGLSWHNGGGGIQLLTVPSDPAGKNWEWRTIADRSLHQDLRAGDIDRDGDVDFTIGTVWLRNDADEYSWQTLYETERRPDRVLLVDVNSDGRLDSVVGFLAISKPGTLAWYEQPPNPNESWIEHVVSTSVVGPMSLDAADLDEDGDLDLIVGEHNLKQAELAKLILFENRDGSGRDWRSHAVAVGDEHHDGAVTVDIDGDGDLDVISVGWGHPRVLLFENPSRP